MHISGVEVFFHLQRSHIMFRPVLSILLGIVGVLVAAAPSVWALPPLGKEIVVKPVKAESTYQIGMRLQVTLKGKEQPITGTLVWLDRDQDYLLIREQSGATPRKIPGDSIERVNPLVSKPSKGGITPAADTDTGYQPEIHQVTVQNGSAKSVKYFAPSLSPGERTRLTELENAENEVSRVQDMVSLAMESLRAQLQVLQGEITFQERRNLVMGLYFLYTGYWPPPVWDYGAYGAYPGLQGANYAGGNAGPTFESLMHKQITLTKTLSDARANLAALQANAYYDGDRLVAVNAGEKIKPAADKEK
jgi:hypothetical protein